MPFPEFPKRLLNSLCPGGWQHWCAGRLACLIVQVVFDFRISVVSWAGHQKAFFVGLD